MYKVSVRKNALLKPVMVVLIAVCIYLTNAKAEKITD